MNTRMVLVTLIALMGCEGPSRAENPFSTAPDSGGSGGAGASGGAGTGSGGSAAASGGTGGSAAASAGSGGAGAGAGAGGSAGEAPVGDAGTSDDDYLGLAAPARGFRLATIGREIPAGADVEYCEVQALPGTPDDEYIVHAVETANALGSHHIIVTVPEPGSPAEEKLLERAIGEQVPCIGAEAEFGRQTLRTIASSQTRYVRSDFPEGVGIRLHGGQRVVFDYHYFNFDEAPIEAKSAIAVHTLEPNAAVTIASYFAFTNMTIDTPPGTEKTFTAACTFERDAMVAGIGRHTHAFGTNFKVWHEGGAQHGEEFWSSDDWEHDTGYFFDPPRLVKAGEGFKFACSFRNEGDRALRFGIRSTDEMCILAGGIYSPEPGIELAPESCVITWIDEDGMGHDARDAGGFPKATDEDALACHVNAFGLTLLSECVGCICDSCATIMSACNADVDCKANLDCSSTCQNMQASMPSGVDCEEQCEPVMFEHSSGVGMITQVGECILSQCGPQCAITPPM